VTFTEFRAVKESSGTNPDGSEAISLTSGSVTLTATITDHDGDFATASLDLGARLSFLDDGPTNFTRCRSSRQTLRVRRG